MAISTAFDHESDQPMKVLIGAAAVAIIAYVGYFFYVEWRSAEDARLTTEAATLAENNEAIGRCRAIAADLRTVTSGISLGRRFVQADAKQALRNCLMQGYLTEVELADLRIE